MTAAPVAGNVEALQVQYARSTSDLHTRFYNANQISATVSPSEWDDVSAVRLWILVRASTPEPGYVNNSSYVLGDRTITVNAQLPARGVQHPRASEEQMKQQRGFSLVVTLILMALVMVLGLSAYKVSRTSQTLAGNVQFRGAAFSEAEAAAELAENWLAQGTNFRNTGFTTYASGTGLYPQGYMAAHAIDPVTMTWSSSNSVAGSDANQRYLIELLAANGRFPPAAWRSAAAGRADATS